MATMHPDELAGRLAAGLLSFPVTHFDDALAVDEERYRAHLAWQAGHDVAGLFAAGGTGEGFSLTPAEIDRVVRVAVDEVGHRVPVLARRPGAPPRPSPRPVPRRRPAPPESCCCRRT